MNLGETANLVVRLQLDDKLSGPLGTLRGKMKGLNLDSASVTGGLGKISSGIKTGLVRSLALGAGAFGLLTLGIKGGIQSLADLEDANNQTKAVIESTAGAAGLAVEDIRAYAEGLEELTAVDDKVIQSGANLLLTFKGVKKDAFEPALEAALDMAEAMDMELEPAVLAIGKALNDPIKGIGRLEKAGIQFTDEQEALIKTLVEENDLFGAQQVILGELESQFGGSAKAAASGYRGTMDRLRDTVEELQMALAEALFPAIKNVAEQMRAWLSDPQVKQGIKNLGEGIAGLFSKENVEGGGQAIKGLFNYLRDLPWDSIRDGLKFAAEGAKAVVGVFRSLPPDVQKGLLAFLAANKLTGGLVSAGIGELLKVGLRSLTSIVAGNVTVVGKSVVAPGAGLGGGGAAAAGGGAAAAAGKGGMLVNTLKVLGAATFAGFGLFELFNTLGRQQQEVVDANRSIDQSLIDLAASNPTEAQINAQIAAMQAVPGKLDPIQQALFNMNVNGVKTTWEAGLNELIAIKGRLNMPQPGDPNFIGPVPVDQEGIEERILRQNNASLISSIGGLGNRLAPILTNLQTADDDMFLSMQSVIRNAGLLTQSELQGVKGKLDTNNNGIVSMKEVTRAGLDATKGQLQALNRKDFSPTVQSTITIRNDFNVSARAIFNATQRYRTSGANVKL